jgi:hypothetical protein
MKIAIFCVVMRVLWQVFTGVSEKHAASIRVDCPEEGDNTFLRSIGVYITRRYGVTPPKRVIFMFSSFP